MALLTTVRAAPGARRIDVEARRGRLVVVGVLALAMLGAAALRHAIDRETAAAWFTGMGEAVLFGAVGVLIGETIGARDAESRLSR